MSEVRESFPAPFDDIMLLKPFLLACWLTSVCAAEPHHYTLTLSTCWHTRTHCLSLRMFQHTLTVLFALTLSSRLLFISHGRPQKDAAFWTPRWGFWGQQFSPIIYQHRLCFSWVFVVFCLAHSLNPDRCHQISVYQTVLCPLLLPADWHVIETPLL